MSKAIFFKETGSFDVLKATNVKIPSKIPPGHALIRQTAIGVNFNDILYRKGIFKYAKYPVIPGMEAAGVVEAVGAGAKVPIGKRVVYCTAPSGAYAEHRIINEKLLAGIPEQTSDEVAAGSFCKAITAHYLLLSAYSVRRNMTILVNAAAGGVGSMICQWARFIGAKIIGAVGSSGKVSIAKKNGCDHVFVCSDENFIQKVKQVTNGAGVDVVYDGVGKSTFKIMLECLKRQGLMVSYGYSSGLITNFNYADLIKKGVYLTCPTLQTYRDSQRMLILSAIEVFTMLDQGHLRPKIFKQFKLEQAAEAHKLLEARKTIGSIILKP